jgi:acyl dehydratase
VIPGGGDKCNIFDVKDYTVTVTNCLFVMRRVLSSASSHVKVGQVVTLKRGFTGDDVATFASLIGDHNPVHSSGSVHQFQDGKPIVHGMLVSSLISASFGTAFPGCIYLSQELKFKSPVFIDDELESRVTFLTIRKSAKLQTLIATCSTEIFKIPGKSNTLGLATADEEEELVIDGRASVLLPKTTTLNLDPVDQANK